MPKVLPLAFVALAILSNVVGAAPRNEREPEIRALVEEKINSKGPGVAVLVSRRGVPLHLAAYGFADLGTGAPITPDSLFDLASVAKQMTGVAILTLVEKGRLNLNEPAARYLPDFAVPVRGREVTVTDLLHHVSGLADFTSGDWDGGEAKFATLTTETHLKWLNGTKARRAPGRKYEYNNSGYVLLALIVERVSGQSFAKYAQAHLFAPAGMAHTVVLDGTTKLPSQTVQGYATNDNGKVTRSFAASVVTGDGNVYTSIRDLALWDKAVRDHKVISKRSQELAWTNGRYDNGKPIRNDDGDGYGFGWVIEKNLRIVSHSGSWDGTASYLLLDLQEGFTIAVLSNDEKTDVGDLVEEILALFASE